MDPHGFWIALLHILGVDNVSGPWYAWWSGPAGDLALLSFPVGAILWYWHHTCHIKGCLWLGRHPVEGTTYTVCWRHHPRGEPSLADVLAAHEAHQLAKESARLEAPVASR